MRIEPEKRLIKHDKNPDVLKISKGVTIESGGLTLGTSGSAVTATYLGSETKDFGSLADAAEVSEDVTVTGAALGDFAIASMGVDIVDLNVTAAVTAANTATVRLENQTGGAVDLASTTLRVLVFSVQ